MKFTLRHNVLILSIILLSLPICFIQAVQGGLKLSVSVIDASNKEPLEFANVILTKNGFTIGGVTNAKGMVVLSNIKEGSYNYSISFIGYKEEKGVIKINHDTKLNISLQPTTASVQEIVVTASESKGITSSSKIDRAAMEHLQPSSFTDIVSMLPGGVVTDPKMSEGNFIKIREAGGESKGVTDYNMSSLGTSFVIDGVPQQNNADMQYETNSWSGTRSSTGKGVDMRSVSTDDIGNVEIVRGIPSVEYGDLTSGLVNINRKKGGNKLDARFKADMQSKLFYVGKGIENSKNNLKINMSLDFLDAKDDPRNAATNYKRVTSSFRFEKEWRKKKYSYSLDGALNYTGSFENDNDDPDLTLNGTKNEWKSNKNKISLDNKLMISNREKGFFRKLCFTTSFSLEQSLLHQLKTVLPNRIYGVPTMMETGESDAQYLPDMYEAHVDTKGLPFYAFLKLVSSFSKKIAKSDNLIKIGLEWSTEKNYGEGKVYDMTRPIDPGTNYRPRKFSDIPANDIASFFAEDVTTFPIGKNNVEIRAGIRGSEMVNLDKKYALSNKIYLDPRVNMQWSFPEINIKGEPFQFSLSAGGGLHTKMPVMAYLYPDMYYYDLIQLNYYHNNPDYRKLNLMTYKIDKTNYDLKSARNLKWEIRADFSYCKHNLSITYYKEKMTSGFLNTRIYNIYTYKRYDTSSIDHANITAAPDVSTLPYNTEKTINTTERITNDGIMSKEGIEFQYSSPRIESLHTRVTVNGAWMKSKYDNGVVNYYKPSVVINNRQIEYIGLYHENNGYLRESFNTNFIFDTYLPKLKMGFSTQLQCIWLVGSQSLYQSGIPFAYIGTDGVEKQYTEESMNDGVLKHLIVKYSPQIFDYQTVPFEMGINFRATKSIWKDKIKIAMYVNKILNYAPDYKRYGATIRRTSSPYFGMELNFKL